ncbi:MULTISPECIES: CaiB/BaiF CoA transferase family protein [Marivita]|uniref:CoA transferase n=1 Tax=Marivita cryptomonadis TaxID=505252 RepID=A0A9Q2NX31_9RHOB|nr:MULTISPECIES: CoA transferase [Marivita]MCR9168021.1 CoA transferase [Paracoccaceae bacterium]MBM2321401.1 CoA transferase [Marivita cryptomonadis]MBM2330982.1 CoA transferase [Marivita cryptomonadis]MBM2340568.1 CoA transferase [Marivita cryptomonadis]MBM2345230.1 CoA transferase [Marivita cryptomonadis]
MSSDGPLTGVRIVDLTHVLAGPYATGQLALMGAEVIRVERPNSDDFVRRHGGTQAMKDAGLGASFLSQNSGKRSIVLDLKDPDQRAQLLELAKTANVMVENFRPGIVEKLGVGFDDIRGVRPDIIYASLNGYGADGPLSDRPAYDHILQGISGLMAMTGEPGSGPMRVGLPIVDYVAGQALVAALLAALLQKARKPGEAQRLSVSMLDAMTTFMGAYAIHHETTGQLRGLEGNRAFADTPFSGRFDTAEGSLVITANTPAQATRLCVAIGRPELADHTDSIRIADTLTQVFLTDDAQTWEDRLSAANVPAAKVRTLAEALDHPQMKTSRAWLPLEVPQLGMTVRAPALPFSAPWGPDRLDPVPTLGQHTADIVANSPEKVTP